MKEKRVPWTLITGVLVLFFVLALFSPSAAADTNDGKTRRLMFLLQYVFDFVENNYVDEVDPEVLAEGAFKGIFESLGDPHSAYLTASDLRGLGDTTTGEFAGVGLYINKQVPRRGADGRDGPSYVEVVAPIEDTPAYRAGIQAGDLITKVEEESTDGMSISDVVDKLRGPVNTTVTVTIRRGPVTSFEVPLKRAKIEVPTVKYAMIPGSIAYMRIIQFTPHTPQRITEAVEYFNSHKYSRLIVDLRSNPGGVLDSVVAAADLFFNDGLIVGTKSRLKAENRIFEAKPGVIVPESVPMIVLIDSGSASASEIFAGAMKDRGRALLLGTKSYGKGSVQQVHGMPFGKGGFRLTMARYHTPSGHIIDGIGIEPDKVVKDPDLTEEETLALAKLIESRKVRSFVQENPEPKENQVSAFVAQLAAEFPGISGRLLQRIVRNEVSRHMVNPPVYDMEYDTVLREAVRLFSAGFTVGAQR